MDNTEFSLKLLEIVREIEKTKKRAELDDVFNYLLEETEEEVKTKSKDIYDDEWNHIWTYEEVIREDKDY